MNQIGSPNVNLNSGFGLGSNPFQSLFGPSVNSSLNFGGLGNMFSGGGGLQNLFGGGGANPFSAGGLAGGFAGMGGNMLSGALGMDPNMLGTLGGIGGSFFGPLGSFAGSFLGNALGDAFGMGAPLPPRARANYIYDFASGNPTMKGGKGYDQAWLDAFGSLTDQVGDTARELFEKLGIQAPVSNFGFGAFKGRAGFALPTDPWVRDPSSPGAFNSIGNSNKLNMNGQARAAGRVFGQSQNRTDVPTGDNITQAAQAALNALVTQGISNAGLTNAQVFQKLGLPQDQAGFQSLLGSIPNFQFGQNFDFAAPSQFTATDLLAAMNLAPGLLGQGGMAGQPAAQTTAQTNTALSRMLGVDLSRLNDPGTVAPELLASLRAMFGG